MVDGSGGSEEEVRGSAQSSGDPQRNDPRLVQAAIPDGGGIVTSAVPVLDEEAPAASEPDAIASLLSSIAASYQERLGLSERLFSEADCYAIKTVADAELFVRKLQLLDHFADIKGRRKYAALLFGVIIAWLVLVLLTLCMSAVQIELPQQYWGWVPIVTEFDLSEGVILALIGSTTVNVIGLFYVVVRYLFPRRDGDKPVNTSQGAVRSPPRKR